MYDTDIAIIGAGAAGLMAAIFAGRNAAADVRVVAFDGARRLGAKILISGGGRCNVTHDVVQPDDFNGANRNHVARVLRSFTVEDTVEFFQKIGIDLKREETGKLFPTTDRARDVVDALARAVHNAGAEIALDHRVTAIEKNADGFEVRFDGRREIVRRVILATGGLSVPKTGSDGGGYALARALGHSVTHTTPALVPLLLPPDHWLTHLSGLSLDVELRVVAPNGKVLRRDSGSMLFTHFGLSGPVVLDISRHWIAERENDDVQLHADLGLGTYEEVETLLRSAAAERPRALVKTVVGEFFPERFALALLEYEAMIPTDRMLGRLTRDERRQLVRALTALPLPVTADRGYNYAEVTAGGVPLEEVNIATMESKLVPGLYLCGEILNVDGRIGGYNFQWAWATGRLAGMSAVRH